MTVFSRGLFLLDDKESELQGADLGRKKTADKKRGFQYWGRKFRWGLLSHKKDYAREPVGGRGGARGGREGRQSKDQKNKRGGEEAPRKGERTGEVILNWRKLHVKIKKPPGTSREIRLTVWMISKKKTSMCCRQLRTLKKGLECRVV